MLGELEKLKVVAYSDPEFNNKISDGTFSTLMNPEKYTYHYKIETDKTQASGTSTIAPKFNKKLPENLELDFVFDRSGVINGYESSDDGIIDDIEKFKKVVLNYNGDKHKPNYLIISWGTLLFKGALTEMDVEFKLFKPDGTPIRAVAKVKFQGFVEDNLRAARENNKSPDLTHYRTVKEGDTLPLMSFQIYGDSKYYLEVAKANNIVNFRKLKTGQKLFFPPLQKQS
ncbi:LysM peptidoglycan-binding domain-containing protein [Flavobacterium sp. Fl-318]|uniref:LysM peptidoglycan-binding domain-containing protein n=1 Tax=Flavobacterium cupriresistens TaxID=2893885 RepID=A0ABU4R890_9FLAO|nr:MULTISPECIES: LysM peptidoglycan-binding domain-containing protein [unclassified Flavobacterium]MDX6188802.1 LysM peptidoglycan-binding domain-containing protein [Flavobacterium sp. Fl-318]UFH44412.1 LysM peptidoglycan-binding domain-containing protein [Flavobacterium sp. F-323]